MISIIFKKITEKPERAELLFRAFYKNPLNGFRLRFFSIRKKSFADINRLCFWIVPVYNSDNLIARKRAAAEAHDTNTSEYNDSKGFYGGKV